MEGALILCVKLYNFQKKPQVILKLIQINDYFSSKVNLKKRYFVIFENSMEVGL